MDCFEADVARSYMFTSDVIKARMFTSSVSNVIYYKFSPGAAFYTLNGKNVKVMLKFLIRPDFFYYFLVLWSADPIFLKTRIKIKMTLICFIFIFSADLNFPPQNEIKFD